jgi:regulator of sigma E protease
MDYELSALVAACLPAIVIFIHDFGHYVVGRILGIQASVLSLGLGPELWGFDRPNGTRWKVCAIPIGGYVRFPDGPSGSPSVDPWALSNGTPSASIIDFSKQPVWKRIAVNLAGPAASFLLAIALFTGGVDHSYFVARIGRVLHDGPADKAGIRVGDIILTMNGQNIRDFRDAQAVTQASDGQAMEVVVQRQDERVRLFVTPRPQEVETPNLKGRPTMMIGIASTIDPADRRVEKFGVVAWIESGAKYVWFSIKEHMYNAFQLVSVDERGDQFKTLLSITGDFLVSKALLISAGQLSIVIGLVNLLPIPLLDGGNVAFLLAELLRGCPISDRSQEMMFKFSLIGIIMFLTLLQLRGS